MDEFYEKLYNIIKSKSLSKQDKRLRMIILVNDKELKQKILSKVLELSQSKEIIKRDNAIEVFGKELFEQALMDVNNSIRNLGDEEIEEIIFGILCSPDVDFLVDISEEKTLRYFYEKIDISKSDDWCFSGKLALVSSIKQDDLKQEFKQSFLEEMKSLDLDRLLALLNRNRDNIMQVLNEEEYKALCNDLLNRILENKKTVRPEEFVHDYLRLIEPIQEDEFYKENINKISKIIKERIRLIEESSGKDEYRESCLYIKTVAGIVKSENDVRTYEFLFSSIPEGKVKDTYIKALNFFKFHDYREGVSESDTTIGLQNQETTYGVEIEANFEDAKIPYFDMFLNDSLPSVSPYGDWEFSTDATVPIGNEVVSPPLTDKPEAIKELYAICGFLQDVGFNNTNKNNVAGQINIGINNLDTARSIINFYELYCNSEELLYHICNEEGDILRANINTASKFGPISNLFGTISYDENMSREELLDLIVEKQGINFKKNSIALRDMKSSKSARLEFRMPNGTIKPEVWIDNIRLFGRMVEVAKEIDLIQDLDNPTEEQLRKLNLKESLKKDVPLDEKLEILMDLLFDDEKIKQIYKNRFRTLERMISEKSIDKYSANPGTFKTVQFEKVHSDLSVKREKNIDDDDWENR